MHCISVSTIAFNCAVPQTSINAMLSQGPDVVFPSERTLFTVNSTQANSILV